MPHRAPGSPHPPKSRFLTGQPIRHYRPRGNPGVTYCDTTIAFPLFCEYVVGAPTGRRPLKRLLDRRADLVADLHRQARERLADGE